MSPDVGTQKVVKGTDLGDRMKEYEAVSQGQLTRRMPLIVRVDGKAFHSLTRKMEKPWDIGMRQAMSAVAQDLVDEQGGKIAYAQSDEVSVLYTDYDALNTDAWFGKNLQKVVSVSASLATRAFNGMLPLAATFDARAFVLPKEEVCNYFVWRQRDAIRNSIQGLAQAHFSAKRLHGLNTDQLQGLLWQECGLNWSKCEDWQKRGWCAFNRGGVVLGIPEFTADRNYIDRFVFLEETA